MYNLNKYVISINDERLKEFKISIKDSEFGYNVTPFKGVKKKMIGCTLSHLNLWKYIIDTNIEPAVIIFEDDAQHIRPCCTQDDTTFEHFMLDENVGVLLLGWNPGFSHATEQQPHYYTGHATDSHAYILKTSFARRYIDKYAPFFENRLHQMFAPLGAIDHIFLLEKVALSIPIIFIQRGEENYVNMNLHVDITNRKLNKIVLQITACLSHCVFYHKFAIIIIVIITIVSIIKMIFKK